MDQRLRIKSNWWVTVTSLRLILNFEETFQKMKRHFEWLRECFKIFFDWLWMRSSLKLREKSKWWSAVLGLRVGSDWVCRVWRYHKWGLRAGQARLACALTLKLSQHKWLFGNIDKWRPGATSTAPLYSLARANLSLSCVNITVSLSLFNLGKFCFCLRGSLVGVWKL